MNDFRFFTLFAFCAMLFSCNGCNQAFDNKIKLDKIEKQLEVIMKDIESKKLNN